MSAFELGGNYGGEIERAWREVTNADLVCALALVTFAAARLTLAHDHDPDRRRGAIVNSVRAVDGLLAVCRALIGPERKRGSFLSTEETARELGSEPVESDATGDTSCKSSLSEARSRGGGRAVDPLRSRLDEQERG